MPGIGTLVNTAAVAAGSLLGWAVGDRLPAHWREITLQAVGGVTLLIGVRMALTAEEGSHIVALLCSLVAGSILGEAMGIEQRLDALGRSLEARLSRRGREGRFTKAFVTSSLLFCVGPMTVLGSLQDGLFGDATLLFTKSALDGISALVLAAALGIGTLFSAGTVFVYQGTLTLLAHGVERWLTPAALTLLNGAGGVMIMAIGLNIWQVARLRVGNMLPALVVAGVVGYFLG